MKGFLIAAIGLMLVIVSAYLVWNEGEKADLQTCKQRYGEEYTLGHSNTNSSIKWCQSPSGEMKSL